MKESVLKCGKQAFSIIDTDTDTGTDTDTDTDTNWNKGRGSAFKKENKTEKQQKHQIYSWTDRQAYIKSRLVAPPPPTQSSSIKVEENVRIKYVSTF